MSAGIIDPADFWKPLYSLGKIIGYRWRGMPLMLRDDPAIETHAVFRRPIPMCPQIEEAYP